MMYTSLFRELLTYMMEDPRNIASSHPSAVHRQEHRAHRRPRHQHRGADRISRPRPALLEQITAEGRPTPASRSSDGPGAVTERDRRRAAVSSHWSWWSRTKRHWSTLLTLQPRARGLPRRRGARRRGRRCWLAREQKPDLVLLDWMLPLLSGMEVCRQIRRMAETRGVPIIMLTARGEGGRPAARPRQRRRRLRHQALQPAELVARIRARAAPHRGRRRTARSLQLEDLDDGSRPPTASGGGGRDIHLGPTEFRLLRHLLEHPGPGVQPRSSCSTWSGARTSMSSCARSTSTSAVCARRINARQTRTT